MKSKKVPILALILVALIIGGAIWLFSQKPEYTATTTLVAIPATKTDATKAVTQPVQSNRVEMPKTVAVAAKDAGADAQAQAVAVEQAEATATMQNIARTLREQGIYTIEQTYYAPNIATVTSPEGRQQLFEMDARNKQDPQVQSKNEKLARWFDYLSTLTPTINATSDKASYYGYVPGDEAAKSGPPKKIAVLIKIDGKWMWQADMSGE